MGIVIHGVIIAANTVVFMGPSYSVGYGTSGSTESQAVYRSTRTGKIRRARVFVQSNTKNGVTLLSIRVAGVDVLSTSIPAGDTTPIDIPGEGSVADGQEVSVKADTSASTLGFIVPVISYEIA